MKKCTIIVFILCLLPSFACGQPSLSFTTETRDFGEIGPGEVLEYVFSFTNTGTENLVIEKTVPS